MNNSEPRIRKFQNYAKTQKFISVIAHGTLINPKNTSYNVYKSTFFDVPQGTTIIFISKPGYHVSLATLKDDKLLSLLHSESKLRKLIDDKLPVSEIPDIIKHGHWNWKNHIYIAGMQCPNMGLEFYDETDDEWGRWFNEQVGVWYPGTNKRPEYRGKKGTLKNLISSLDTKGIIVVFGCRGDPQTSERTSRAYSLYGARGEPQKYAIPWSSLFRNVKTLESAMSRYLTLKRARTPGLSLRKQSPTKRSAKRRISIPGLTLERRTLKRKRTNNTGPSAKRTTR